MVLVMKEAKLPSGNWVVLVAKKNPHGGFKFGFGHKKRKSHNDHCVIIFLSQLKPPCGHQVEFELMVIKLFSFTIWF